MTLILKLDLDMVKMYLHTKNEVSMSRGSKVIAWTDRQTDTQTDTQTDRHDWKHYLPTYAGGKYIITKSTDTFLVTTSERFSWRKIQMLVPYSLSHFIHSSSTNLWKSDVINRYKHFHYHPLMQVGNVFGHVCVSVCLCVCLSVFLSVCVSVCSGYNFWTP